MEERYIVEQLGSPDRLRNQKRNRFGGLRRLLLVPRSSAYCAGWQNPPRVVAPKIKWLLL